MKEYQNTKYFLQKVIFQIDQKMFIWVKKLKTLCGGHMFLVILKAKKSLEYFTKKNDKKQNKKNLG